MTQGVLSDTNAIDQFYVDDPIITMRASENESDDLVCRLVLFGSMLGPDLTTHTAQLSREITWVGYTGTDATLDTTMATNAAFPAELREYTDNLKGEESDIPAVAPQLRWQMQPYI